jgi:hypothetical protein
VPVQDEVPVVRHHGSCIVLQNSTVISKKYRNFDGDFLDFA